MRKMFACLAAAAAISFTAPAAAAVTLTFSPDNTKVIGASGVVVNGTTYDVTFQDGTCAGLFGGCDAGSDFNFTTAATAQAAAQALLTQVIDAFVGLDAVPSIMRGCAENWICDAYIPFQLNGTTVTIAAASNAGTGFGNDSVYTQAFNGFGSFDTVNNTVATYAVFRPSQVVAPVPEPATWAMMLLGFGGIRFSMRRSRKSILQQIA